jgi:hypothetical protein
VPRTRVCRLAAGCPKQQTLGRHFQAARARPPVRGPVLRVEPGRFSAHADNVRAVVQAAAGKRSTLSVVLDCETVPFDDATATGMLGELSRSLRRKVVQRVARDVGQVRDMLAGPYVPRLFQSVRDAIAAVRQRAAPSHGKLRLVWLLARGGWGRVLGVRDGRTDPVRR